MIRPKVLDSIGITKGKRVDLRAAQVGLSDDGADGSRDVGYGGHVVVSDGRRSLWWLVKWISFFDLAFSEVYVRLIGSTNLRCLAE